MGCGAAKLAVASSVVIEGGNKDETRGSKVTILSGDGAKANVDCKAIMDKEDVVSNSVPSITSETSSSFSSESDTTESQDGPQRIKANTDYDSVEESLQPKPVPTESKTGFVAFDISLDETKDTPFDPLLRRPLPTRLKVGFTIWMWVGKDLL